MTNPFPRVSAILARIPDAATRWPEWFWPFCGVCGESCEKESGTDHPFCRKHDDDNIVWKFDPPTDGHGMDVWLGDDLDPRNMHHLWEIMKALDYMDNPCLGDEMELPRASVWLSPNDERVGNDANIIEAMLRCLEDAVK